MGEFEGIYAEEDMKPRFRVLMGLDISTKTIGVTVATLDEAMNLKILEVDYVSLNCFFKKKDPKFLHEKVRMFEHKLREKYIQYHVTDVIIEKAIYCEKNMNTSMMLLSFNGMCADAVYRILGVAPVYISSHNARKYSLPELLTLRKYDRDGNPRSKKEILKSLRHNRIVLFGEYPYDCSKKYIIWNIVKEKFSGIKWRYDKEGHLLDENFDAADSLLCVVGYANMLKYGDTFNPEMVDADIKDDLLRYTVSFCGEKFSHTLPF